MKLSLKRHFSKWFIIAINHTLNCFTLNKVLEHKKKSSKTKSERNSRFIHINGFHPHKTEKHDLKSLINDMKINFLCALPPSPINFSDKRLMLALENSMKNSKIIARVLTK